MVTIKARSTRISLKMRSLAIVTLAGMPALAFADTLDSKTCGNFLPSALCTDDLYSVLGLIANYMVGIFGSLFVLMVIISGVQMASAGDSPDRLKAAKSRLMNAVVALVLLISFRALIALFGLTV